MLKILYQYLPQDEELDETQEKYATKYCVYLKSVDDDCGLVQFSNGCKMLVSDFDLQEVYFCGESVVVKE